MILPSQEECDEGLSFTLVRRTGMHYLSLASRETHGFFLWKLKLMVHIYFFGWCCEHFPSFLRINMLFFGCSRCEDSQISLKTTFLFWYGAFSYIPSKLLDEAMEYSRWFGDVDVHHFTNSKWTKAAEGCLFGLFGGGRVLFVFFGSFHWHLGQSLGSIG